VTHDVPLETFDDAGVAGYIFDLDGTLADTLDDIVAAVRHAREALGVDEAEAPLDRDRVRRFVGHGAAYLARHALSLSDESRVEQAVEAFKRFYARRGLERTRPYDGVREMLSELAARDMPVAVLSNKPEEAARQVVKALFAQTPFKAVRGQRDGQPVKPDPTSALEIAGRLGVAPASLALVGDSEVDIETARRAGMRAIGATWGFRDRAVLIEAGADRLIDHPRQL